MRWTVLSDNRTCDPQLATEHGLSILLETEHCRVLLDTGASDLFIDNARRLGLDLATVDYVFISHAHADHAGGLAAFLEINTKARIIVSPHALTGRYFSRRGKLHSITTTWPSLPAERLLAIDETCELTDGLRVIAQIPHHHPLPQGNRHLFVQRDTEDLMPDDFCHELALYVDGLLFTGCAHSGLENILAACPWPVTTVLGGFHLLDGFESEEQLTALARTLRTAYPHTHFFTSHCTGDAVFSILLHELPGYLFPFRCGTSDPGTESSLSVSGGFAAGGLHPASTSVRHIRPATAADIPSILPVFAAARQIMRSSGNLHQWAEDYPSAAAVESDLRRQGAYVIEDDGHIVAYFACLPSPEPTYSQIYEGQWLDDSLPYHVVHRIASYPSAHHIFRDLMDYCFAKSSSPHAPGGNIRIDTHRDNSIMQHLILNYGFTYCGIIYLTNGDERLAYQKLLR